MTASFYGGLQLYVPVSNESRFYEAWGVASQGMIVSLRPLSEAVVICRTLFTEQPLHISAISNGPDITCRLWYMIVVAVANFAVIAKKIWARLRWKNTGEGISKCLFIWLGSSFHARVLLMWHCWANWRLYSLGAKGGDIFVSICSLHKDICRSTRRALLAAESLVWNKSCLQRSLDTPCYHQALVWAGAEAFPKGLTIAISAWLITISFSAIRISKEPCFTGEGSCSCACCRSWFWVDSCIFRMPAFWSWFYLQSN